MEAEAGGCPTLPPLPHPSICWGGRRQEVRPEQCWQLTEGRTLERVGRRHSDTFDTTLTLAPIMHCVTLQKKTAPIPLVPATSPPFVSLCPVGGWIEKAGERRVVEGGEEGIEIAMTPNSEKK